MTSHVRDGYHKNNSGKQQGMARIWAHQTPRTLLVGMEVEQLLWRTVTDDPAIPLIGTHPGKLKRHNYTKACTQMFIEAKKEPRTQMSID